jgi:hypothetical protein
MTNAMRRSAGNAVVMNAIFDSSTQHVWMMESGPGVLAQR